MSAIPSGFSLPNIFGLSICFLHLFFFLWNVSVITAQGASLAEISNQLAYPSRNGSSEPAHKFNSDLLPTWPFNGVLSPRISQGYSQSSMQSDEIK